MRQKTWELALANITMLPLLILAGIVSGWWEALAWLGALLYLDWWIVRGEERRAIMQSDYDRDEHCMIAVAYDSHLMKARKGDTQMKTTRRLTVTLLILCLVLPLAGALLFPATAAPLAHSLLPGATRDGVDNVTNQEGSDWQIETVDSDGGEYTSLALDARGYPHISYYANGDLKYAYWDGEAWQIWIADSGGDVGKWTSLALDTAGYPHISYWDATNYDLKYAYWDGSAWQIQTVDSAGDVGQGTSLALDAAGYPHISYGDQGNHALKYARWDGTGWQIETADSTAYVGEHTSLALDAAGHPHISYYYWEYLNSDLEYTHWDGAAWHIETVDSHGDVGWYSSLALDEAGYPHISYYDWSGGQLRYARWDGVTWQIEIVDDSATWVGRYTSLALDGSSCVHISYHDATNEDLKYAYWDGAAWHIETVDSLENVGQYTSLALDGAGYPHISYYDRSNGDLKYARGGIPPVPATISVYTDKASYSAGETMHLGLDMTTAGPTISEALHSYWLLILLRTPSTGVVVVNLPTLRLPPGWSYSNPDFLTFRLPALESGTYTWIGELIPVGEDPAVDSAIWTFTGGEASGQQVVPVEKALKQLGEIDFNLGK